MKMKKRILAVPPPTVQWIKLIVLFLFFTDESFMCLTKHEPVGVCGAIIPVSPEVIWFEFMSNNIL